MSRRALVVAALLLAGCTSAEIPSADPSAPDQQACRNLVEALPLSLDGHENTGRSQYAAAWGDPRIVLKCGVPIPAGYEKTSEMIAIDEVSWFPEQQDDGYLFTAMGRSPLVQVYVPDAYAPEVNPLVDLSPAMADNTQVTGAAGVAP